MKVNACLHNIGGREQKRYSIKEKKKGNCILQRKKKLHLTWA
jgi:hypothetical protein